MKIHISNSPSRFRLTTHLPGDKSISHRAIMFGSLATGKSIVRNFLNSEDCKNTAAIFKRLGVKIRHLSQTHLEIYGVGIHGLRQPKSNKKLYCGNSGTTMRLLSGILAAQPFDSILSGDASLHSRPMKRVVDPLKKMGANISGQDSNHYPPIAIQSSNLQAIKYKLPVASAQVKSCILLASLLSELPAHINEPVISRDHTEQFLKFLGLTLSRRKNIIHLRPGQSKLNRFSITVPGDISSGAFLIAAALLVPNSRLQLKSILMNPTRIGILKILNKMGANIKLSNARSIGPETISNLSVATSKLKGARILKKDIPSLIDELPVLMLIATQASGNSIFEGVEELRVKETDRIHSMVSQLKLMGANIRATRNTVYIKGPCRLQGIQAKSFGDHRTAMSFVIAGLIAQGKTTIDNVNCIKTSFPNFIALMRKAGCKLKVQR